MTIRKYLPVLLVVIVSLLAACSPGNSILLGRWEYFSSDDHSAGVVYEFYEDGTCLFYEFDTPGELLYPAITARDLSEYSATKDTLELKQDRGDYYAAETGSEPIDISFEMTFVSDDELLLVTEGQTVGRTFQRAPLPEMPLIARLALGKKLQHGGMTVVSAERFEGAWQDKYPDYLEVEADHFLAIADPEQWAAVIQVEGRTNPAIYIMVEGEKWWGVIRLELPE